MTSEDRAISAELRRVTNEDVIRFAKRKCTSCRGAGWLQKWLYTDEDHMERTPFPCGCAVRRFNAFAKDKLVKDASGIMCWKDSGA